MYIYQTGEKVLVMTGEPEPDDPKCTILHGKIGRVVGYYNHPLVSTLVEFDEPIISKIYNKAHKIDAVNEWEYYSSKVVPIINTCLRLVI